MSAQTTSPRRRTQVNDLGPITVAHDYFTQRGGAERVACALVDSLDPERVVTALHEADATFAFARRHEVETTILQPFRRLRSDPRLAFLALPFAWRLLAPVTRGTVICSSSGWSHYLRIRGDATKVVYCHNPARWLYQPEDYVKDRSLFVRAVLSLVRPLLTRLDRAAARSADVYVANSHSVADRIQGAYGVTAMVIPPPISLDSTGAQRPVVLPTERFFLTVGRERGYKNTGVLAAAFAQMPQEHLVVVGAEATDGGPGNVSYLPHVSDSELRWLYRHARALVSVSNEDFGLTPLEANAMGTPALVLRAGGFLDSLAEGVSGLFIEESTPGSVVRAVKAFPTDWDHLAVRRHADQFSVENFTRRLLSAASMARTERAAGAAQRIRHAARRSTLRSGRVATAMHFGFVAPLPAPRTASALPRGHRVHTSDAPSAAEEWGPPPTTSIRA
ncbi:glycosyltransferase [Amnibacterium sp.]|uniref:glycosyltransferase n=1 Tax=Amnibacterium sp. TaxID=1872496 RepID=UPI00261F5ED4|nr:glycosyltransferase [Amnibacterium sp.]MCU1473901.1 hypothetical protein [Amnibacterium sp.]